MNKKQGDNSLFDYIIYFMMIVAVIFVIVMIFTGKNDELYFKLILGIWVLFAVIINDFVEPCVMKKFDHMKEYKAQLYVMYAIADAAAYATLYVFVINVNIYKEPIHYIFLACSVLLFFIKTRIYNKYSSTYDSAVDIADKLDDDIDEDDIKVLVYRDRNKNK